MNLDDEVHRFLEDDDQPEGTKDGIRALWFSHLRTGMQYKKRGKCREALIEYAQEHHQAINSSADAEVAVASYWRAGLVRRTLGELEEAVLAFERSRQLFTAHKAGIHPHGDLADVLLELGRIDNAIAVCREALARVDSRPTRQILERALRLKEDLSSSDGAPHGS